MKKSDIEKLRPKFEAAFSKTSEISLSRTKDGTYVELVPDCAWDGYVMAAKENEKGNKEAFFAGVLVSLQVLHNFDAHAQAMELVETVGDIKILERVAKRTGSERDLDTIKWFKTGKR